MPQNVIELSRHLGGRPSPARTRDYLWASCEGLLSSMVQAMGRKYDACKAKVCSADSSRV